MPRIFFSLRDAPLRAFAVAAELEAVASERLSNSSEHFIDPIQTLQGISHPKPNVIAFSEHKLTRLGFVISGFGLRALLGTFRQETCC